MNSPSRDSKLSGYLSGIERSYVNLSKAHRLRVEAWVEKIVAASSNITSRQHAYKYAKLLMAQCLMNSLSQPFDKNPPDGLLPSFPTHLNEKLKNSIGSHETGFWNQIWARLHAATHSNDEGISRVQTHSHVMHLSGSVSGGVEELNVLVQQLQKRVRVLEKQLLTQRKQHEAELVRLGLPQTFPPSPKFDPKIMLRPQSSSSRQSRSIDIAHAPSQIQPRALSTSPRACTESRRAHTRTYRRARSKSPERASSTESLPFSNILVGQSRTSINLSSSAPNLSGISNPNCNPKINLGGSRISSGTLRDQEGNEISDHARRAWIWQDTSLMSDHEFIQYMDSFEASIKS